MLVSELSHKILWWLHSCSWNQYSLLGHPQFLPKRPKKLKHPGGPRWVETLWVTLELVIEHQGWMWEKRFYSWPGLCWALLGLAPPALTKRRIGPLVRNGLPPHIPACWTSIRVVGEGSFWRENRILGLGWAFSWFLNSDLDSVRFRIRVEALLWELQFQFTI